MAINYGILQNVQPSPSVITTTTPPQQGVGALGTGIMSGILQGQQMQLNAKQNENADLAIQRNKIGLDQEQKKATEADTLRASAQQGMEQYRSALAKISPVDAISFDKAMSDLKSANEDIKGKSFDNYIKTTAIQGNFAGRVAQGRNPQESAQIWDILYKDLPPEMKKSVPEHYDQNVMVAMISSATFAQADYLAKHPREAKRDAVSPTGKVQQDIATKQQEIAQKKAAGMDTTQPEQELANLQISEKNSISGNRNILSPGEQVTVATSTDRLKELNKAASVERQNKQNLDLMGQYNNNVEDGTLANVKVGTNKALQSVMGIFGVPVDNKTSGSEAFTALARQVQLNYQQLLKGSSSDRDMELVGQAAPQLNNTKEGRAKMINLGKYKAEVSTQYADFMNEWSKTHNGDLSGADEQWSQYVGSTSNFNPKSQTFKLGSVNRSAWKPFLDESYKVEAAKTDKQTPASSPYSADEIAAEMKRRGL
jgi:hypothetical protein